jgi:hypothetical protein
VEFVERGWSLKAIHRLLVTSATYRQASRHDEAKAALDPDNELWWRVPRRRLEGEALRDAMLAVSGQLNLKGGGPSVYPEMPAEVGIAPAKWPVSAEPAERNRRSVYVFAKRNLRYPLFSTFDAPDGNEPCARRYVSTNAPQALMLLNGPLALEQARAFAGRVLAEEGTDPNGIINRSCRLALGRPPDATERQALGGFLAKQAEALRPRLAGKDPPPAPRPPRADLDPAFGAAVVDLCHVLLNVNEFLYVD